MEDISIVWRVNGDNYRQEFSSLEIAMFHALRVSEATNSVLLINEVNWMTGQTTMVRRIAPNDFKILRRKQQWQEPPKYTPPPPPPRKPLSPIENAILTMGLGSVFTYSELKSAYRKKAKSAHPDQGGSAKAFQDLSNHYNFIKQTKGWK